MIRILQKYFLIINCINALIYGLILTKTDRDGIYAFCMVLIFPVAILIQYISDNFYKPQDKKVSFNFLCVLKIILFFIIPILKDYFFISVILIFLIEAYLLLFKKTNAMFYNEVTKEEELAAQKNVKRVIALGIILFIVLLLVKKLF